MPSTANARSGAEKKVRLSRHQRDVVHNGQCRPQGVGVDLAGRIRSEHLIADGVEECLDYVTPAVVFVPTNGGAAARSIARFRFPAWTIAVSSQEATCQNLQFSSGVYPVHELERRERWTAYIRHLVSDHEVAGNPAILTEGPSSKHPETNHKMEIIELTR